jgi:hypothetical protein
MRLVRWMVNISLLYVAILSLGYAQSAQRALLYPAMDKLSPAMQEIVKEAQNPGRAPVSYEKLSPTSQYYLRMAPRQYTINDQNQLLDSAILSTKPYAFVTTPEACYGKSLLDIYLDIGYEAEDIIRWQRDVPMVGIIFRLRDNVTLSDVLNGELPADWQTKVFVPTWDNVFSLLKVLAQNATIDPTKKGEFAPSQLFFRESAQQQLAISFPTIGKERIKNVNYAALKATGGTDWAYRELLEQKLSIFEHFRGTGRTMNEIVDPQGVSKMSGVFEFVVPNSKLSALAEVAIIDLGKLQIQHVMGK